MDIPTQHSSKDPITMTFTQTSHVLKHRSFSCTKSGINIQICGAQERCNNAKINLAMRIYLSLKLSFGIRK
jgi:hypothetical protein